MTRRPTTAEKGRYAFLHEIGVCAVTGREGDIQVAHIRSPDPFFGKTESGMGRKPHWVWTLPLSFEAHTSQHRSNERAWWSVHGFDWDDRVASPLVAALALEGFRSMDDVEGARTWLRERANGGPARRREE